MPSGKRIRSLIACVQAWDDIVWAKKNESLCKAGGGGNGFLCPNFILKSARRACTQARFVKTCNNKCKITVKNTLAHQFSNVCTTLIHFRQNS